MLTKKELAKKTGGVTFHLSNENFACLLLYIAEKEGLGDKKRANIVKFLIDPRKYVKLKEKIESGKMKSEDTWEDFGNYLGIKDCNISLQEGMVVEGSMEVVEDSMEVVEDKESSMDGDEKGMMEDEEGQENKEMSSSASGEQSGEGEMVRRVLEETYQPDMVTNSLVIDVVKLHKKVKTLSATAAVNFIIRSLGLSNNSSITWKVWSYMRYTSTKVKGVGEESNQPWIYLGAVTSLTSDTASHPLDSLISKLQEIKTVATSCLKCSSLPQYYCVRCVTAVYCSTDCMVEHWEEGHFMECGAWTDIIHSQAGLIPPPTDIAPALRAACMARARAQSRVHTAVTEYVAAVNREEESREREEQVLQENTMQKQEIARLGCQV